MRWSVGIGRIMGIKVEVHVTFLLFVAFLAVVQGFATGDLSRAVGTAVLLFAVFACVLLHELGHAFAARRYGIRTRDIVLLPIGGVARLERMPEKPVQEIVVALAGPAVNVLILAVLFAVIAVTGNGLSSDVLANLRHGLVPALVAINVVMVLFNLLPAFPMDGGRVLRGILGFFMPFGRATRIASTVGQGMALLFAAYGLGLFGNPGNPMLMFIALFVFLAAGEERAVVQTRQSLDGVPVRDAMLTEFHWLDSREPLQRAIELLIAGSQHDFPIVEDDRVVGVLTRADLVKTLQRQDSHRAIGEVLTRDDAFAEAGEPLEGVLGRMRERSRSAIPVLHDGRLVGLLTLENVGDLLLVQDALRRRRGAA